MASSRGCEVPDLLRTLTLLRVTQAEMQRVAYYRWLDDDGHHVPGTR